MIQFIKCSCEGSATYEELVILIMRGIYLQKHRRRLRTALKDWIYIWYILAGKIMLLVARKLCHDAMSW